MNRLRNLIWLYLWLLVFEGALRKWVLPSLDSPLLIIRDPLVVWIYYEAWRNRLTFNNAFFVPTILLAIMTAIFSTIFGLGNPLVTMYGLRTDFLQIPLIFLIPQILNRDDVISMGRFLFYVTIPIAVLVVLQFRAPPDSFLNKGAMATHYGTVRPSGTFSFVPGLSAFFALTASFLFYGFVQARTYKIWLLGSVTFAILLASACSGSRTCLASIGLVAVIAVLCVLARGKGAMGIIVAAVLIGIAVPILSSMQVVQTGTEQLQQRIKDANGTESDSGGFVGRFAGSVLEPILSADEAPIFGYGLGIGTNAGAAMSHADLYWPEGEWDRLIFECGPIFGILLCIFRVALTVAVARQVLAAVRRDNILPALIFAACGLLILNGQWGVPTTLGFAIFGAGLALAAGVVPPEEEHDYESHSDETEDESSHSTATDTVG